MSEYSTFERRHLQQAGWNVEAEMRTSEGTKLHLALLPEVPFRGPLLRLLYLQAVAGVSAGFALEPDQARALAEELNHMADLAQGITP